MLLFAFKCIIDNIINIYLSIWNVTLKHRGSVNIIFADVYSKRFGKWLSQYVFSLRLNKPCVEIENSKILVQSTVI